ncbi:RagB/SusD family nutrient uptake outer membrane protein [Ancylomarina euxinus]|uniref:RagB/SusD family nutrient uptake outer membrane protein n=1 Tax=Ancylomarina euxinus TaxID=2283627 RepID=A0A425XYI9_9BACT|nr:RagB/SusD family nutrient uptake outer membrane protein [Ancylomarina euxinus]MCZ4695716.1 RagB/SusD family nutrient uptake outer membrane protein [Ancylomarina euxinus]MUP16169.1 RagB/SusD family nutrient uptake outer membrane protein [Ancylomarina euxinus]RRG20032.1 RagB/SusD family nutrient uptake outer membrane protein [Ancylomarina euxinus]
MKNIKVYISIMLALLVLPSCDEYLDVKPAGTVIPETFEEFRALMNRAYYLTPAENSKLTMRTDEVKFYRWAWENDIASYKDIYLWEDETPAPSTLSFGWQSFYKAIFYANHIIAEGSEITDGTKEEIEQLQGEAYLMRALMHFNLVNQYASHYDLISSAIDKGVPVSTVIDLEANYAPSTVAEVYELVESDLTKGLALLNVEEYGLGKNYRFTRTAANALQARVALYKNEWANALASAKTTLAIKSDLEDLNNSENLIPSEYNSKESIMALEEGIHSAVVNSVFVSDELMGVYDMDNDLRFAKYYSDNGSGSYVVSKGGDDKFRCTFRTAELYLIAAEASAQLDQLDDACDYLNQLKVTRLKPDFYTTEVARTAAMNKAELIKEILTERFRELAFEGHRWFDLRRTTQSEIAHVFGDETVVLRQGDPRYTLPYPQEAINNNPNLAN